MRRWAYIAVTLVLAIAGCSAAALGGRRVGDIALGCGVAWIVQAVSFWLLAGGLERGTRVTRVWIAGMAGRVGAGCLLWLLAEVAGRPTTEMMIAYGLTLVAFLLLEAGWLAVATADRTIRRT